MDEFNPDDHYIYYHGQESLKRNGVALTVNKSEMQYMGAIQIKQKTTTTKTDRMISVSF